MIEIKIMSTNIQYSDNKVSTVVVQFQGSDTDRQINLNGRVTLTAEEYNTNSELGALRDKVKEKVVERLSAE